MGCGILYGSVACGTAIVVLMVTVPLKKMLGDGANKKMLCRRVDESDPIRMALAVRGAAWSGSQSLPGGYFGSRSARSDSFRSGLRMEDCG